MIQNTSWRLTNSNRLEQRIQEHVILPEKLYAKVFDSFDLDNDAAKFRYNANHW
jgi:hypothetical protein